MLMLTSRTVILFSEHRYIDLVLLHAPADLRSFVFKSEPFASYSECKSSLECWSQTWGVLSKAVNAGKIKDLASGQMHTIEPGTLYILDKHDKHILYATTELSLACVFNPPLTGQEVHNEEGSYPRH